MKRLQAQIVFIRKGSRRRQSSSAESCSKPREASDDRAAGTRKLHVTRTTCGWRASTQLKRISEGAAETESLFVCLIGHLVDRPMGLDDTMSEDHDVVREVSCELKLMRHENDTGTKGTQRKLLDGL